MNNKDNKCKTCRGSGKKPRKKHCSLTICCKNHETITCSPDGVQCEYYIPTEPCPKCKGTGKELCQEQPSGEFTKECRDGLHSKAMTWERGKLAMACKRLDTSEANLKELDSLVKMLSGEKELFEQKVEQLQAELDEKDKRIEGLEKALKLAFEAMNYLGDKLNSHDMTEPEDEAVTKEAFEVVAKIIKGGS